MIQNRAYKDLSKYEKIELIHENHICFVERNAYAKYLYALWREDTKTVDFFEQFGNSPRHIISNFRSYKRNLLFGFKLLKIDENGWLERPELIDQEKITIFKHKKNFAFGNSIKLGKGLNGKWTYGYDFSTNISGSYVGACPWGEIFDTKEKAIEAACLKMIEWHKREQSSYSNTVINLANEKIQEVKSKRYVQLELCLF